MFTTYIATHTRILTRAGAVLSAMWTANFYDDDPDTLDDDSTAMHVRSVIVLADNSSRLTDNWADVSVRYSGN